MEFHLLGYSGYSTIGKLLQMQVFPGFEAALIAILVILLVLLLLAIQQKRVLNEELKQKVELINEEIKALKDKHEILEEQNQSLKKLNEEKNNIIGAVSHDLKAPWNRIFALSNLLYLTSSDFSEEQKDYLDKMNLVVREGLDLIRNLLDIRAIEFKGVMMNIEELDVIKILNNKVKTYETYLKRKNQKIILNQENESVIISSDLQYLNRIFDNLISNALKFSPENSTIEIDCSKNQEYVVVKFTDQGPGISLDDQDKLFQKFQVLSAKPTGGESSTGLGLSITKYLVEILKGKIYYENKESSTGATFIVDLPVHASNPES